MPRRAARPSARATDGSFEATDPGTRDNPFWEEFSAQQGSPFCNADCFGQDLARTGDWFSIFGFDVVLGTNFIEQTGRPSCHAASTCCAKSRSSTAAGSAARPVWTGEVWRAALRGAVSQWNRSLGG